MYRRDPTRLAAYAPKFHQRSFACTSSRVRWTSKMRFAQVLRPPEQMRLTPLPFGHLLVVNEASVVGPPFPQTRFSGEGISTMQQQ
jgi:hypothetical protein